MTHEDALDTSAVPRLGLSLGSILAIGLGGALGTLARYLVGATLTTATGHFPATTLLINLSGSLAIGFLVPLTETVSARSARSAGSALARPFLVVGFLGGWTTYSTLAVEAVLLGKGAHVGLAAAYLAASLVGGLALVTLGAAAGRRLVTR
jgi:fluoride exporter